MATRPPADTPTATTPSTVERRPPRARRIPRRPEELSGSRRLTRSTFGPRALLDRLDGQEPWDVRAEYRFVTAKGGFKRIDVDADPALDRRLNQVLQWVADGVGAGVFLPVPGERDRGSFRHCGTCAYDRVCSPTRDESWERKHRALPPLDGPDQA